MREFSEEWVAMSDEAQRIESELAIWVISRAQGPIIYIKDGKVSEIERLVEKARDKVRRTRRDVAERPPEDRPDEYLLVQYMFETLVNDGALVFWTFQCTPQVENEFGDVSGRFYCARDTFLDMLELPRL